MTLHILGPDDPALQVLQTALQKHPEWETDLTIVAWPEYRERLIKALTARRAAYHAVCVPGHVWLPELAEAGYLAALDLDRLPADLVESYGAADILPAVARECFYSGRRYLFPLFTDGHILFYRADRIKLPADGNIPTVSPRQLMDLAARAHRPPKMYGLALKAHPSEIFLDWLPFLWEEGGEILDSSGRPAFAGQAGIRALMLYCSLRQFCPPDTHTFGNAEIAAILKEGRVGLATTWGGQAATILLDADNANSRAYRTAVYPHPWNGTWGVAVAARQSKKSQAAISAVLLRAAGPELDCQVTRVAGSPVRRSSYAEDELERYAWLPAQYEMLERARMLPLHPQAGLFLDALQQAVYAAFMGQVSPRQALARARASITGI